MGWIIGQLAKLGRSGLCLLLAGLLMSGCTSLQPLPNTPDAIQREVKPGDKVRLITRAGEEFKFTVDQVTAESIYGPKAEYPINEIVKLDRQEINAGKTGGLCLGIGLGSFLLAVLLIAAFATATPAI